MRILIIGSGGVGGYFGAVLHRDGHDVTFVARGQHLEAIRQNGLRIESVASGNFTIHPTATERPNGARKADLALFCVKGYDNPGAISIMAPAVGEDTTILTLQNGIGSGDELAAAFGRQKVLVGATYIDAAVKSPGTVAELGGPIQIVSGEEDGRQSPRAQAVRDAMEGAGVDFVLSPHVGVDIWTKLVFVCALSGMMCITRGSLAEIVDTPETSDLTRRVLGEAEEVGRAKGVDLPEDVVDAAMSRLDEGKQSFISSMRVDLDNGRPLEAHVLNGAIARLGKELGVATPVNEFITACLTVAHNRAMARRA